VTYVDRSLPLDSDRVQNDPGQTYLRKLLGEVDNTELLAVAIYNRDEYMTLECLCHIQIYYITGYE